MLVAQKLNGADAKRIGDALHVGKAQVARPGFYPRKKWPAQSAQTRYARNAHMLFEPYAVHVLADCEGDCLGVAVVALNGVVDKNVHVEMIFTVLLVVYVL